MIEVGQIWLVVTDGFTTTKSKRKFKIGEMDRNAIVKLNRWEYVEIRYPHEWHFRTIDNEYFHATPEMILNNCILIGEVLETVRFENKKSLIEILDEGLVKINIPKESWKNE